MAKTRAFVAAAGAGDLQLAAIGQRLVERAEDEYFSRMGWFTRTHPVGAAIRSRDDASHVTYTFFTAAGKAIKHARFNEEWVRRQS